MKEVGIGLLGFGTVGAGVVESLQKNGELIAERAGVRPVLRKIADLDLETDRGVDVDKDILTTDAEAVINDPEIDVIVELVGGTGVAKKFTMMALRAGKPVVTANKALLAKHGREIFAAAREAGVGVCFEAAVAGGIPIIRALTRGLMVNNVEEIYGILNGTCNYILTRMTREGLPFDQILEEAQALGYAEADPGLDIDGHDTAHKAAILASLAYGFHVPLDAVQVDGIRGMAAEDIEYAQELGYAIKLLAVIGRTNGEVEARVYPALVPHHAMLASVSGVFNAVLVKGDVVGQTLYYGRGAGRMPTASAVVSDVADAALSVALGEAVGACRIPALLDEGPIRAAGEIESRYYLRMALKDESGILGRICAILGEQGVSIASVSQRESDSEEFVPVVIITHSAQEQKLQAALEAIEALDCVQGSTVRLRIQDFEEE